MIGRKHGAMRLMPGGEGGRRQNAVGEIIVACHHHEARVRQEFVLDQSQSGVSASAGMAG
ncbi:MAG: hypothetical protein WDM96_07540 [Lacunisphaera sp.]